MVFISNENKDLAVGLNKLPQGDGIALTNMYNRHAVKIERASLPNEKQLFKAMAGDEIDEYLQKQYQRKQARNQRRHRLGR